MEIYCQCEDRILLEHFCFQFRNITSKAVLNWNILIFKCNEETLFLDNDNCTTITVLELPISFLSDGLSSLYGLHFS